MINLIYDNKTYPLKNRTDELTIKEFEHIAIILNTLTKPYMERWSEIFVYLGVPEDVVDDFDADAFISIIQNFNTLTENSTEIIKEVEVDGITYRAYETDFKLTVKELSLIEGYIKKNKERYLGELLAVIYKNVDSDKTINFDKSHLHFKSELFRKELTADVSLPILAYLSKKIIKDYTILENEGTI